ncbi:MAG TPA: SDR family NAD(P)-dependent oxidoreductase [Actinomycetota bacterium]|nr:SDR family NAD(P)-dependent oxidoreductase [Actinomycetota bacterium]
MRRARFEGRRALVTGGASGIGLATARLLREEGSAVALLDRAEAALRRAAEELSAEGVVADVSDPAAVPASVERAADALGGPVDVLVNAAGIYRIAPALDLRPEGWDEVLDVNLRGSFLVAREVARRLREARRGGAVVNVSSIAGLIADAGEPAAHYAASKAGVLALTRQLAAEWAPFGIRVNAVCPGVIRTPMLRLMDDPEAGHAYLQARVPLRRLGEPEEVAAAVAFLASEEASYVTGAFLVVDGGVTST